MRASTIVTHAASAVTLTVTLVIGSCERRSTPMSGSAGAASSQAVAPSAAVPPPRDWWQEKDCSWLMNVPWPSEWEVAYSKMGKFSIDARGSGRKLFEGVRYQTISWCTSHWVMAPNMEESYSKGLEFSVLDGIHEELFVSDLLIPLHAVWEGGRLQIVQVFPLAAPMWEVWILGASKSEVVMLVESLGSATGRVWGEHEGRGVHCSSRDVERMTRRAQSVPAFSAADAAERFLRAQAREREVSRDGGKGNRGGGR
ncbi:MAG: hypothetical protein IT371_29690 [Deltaproteobacteria bacterium]|nr:hypothetical protein [Deltaproteobacteria bacterium]